MAQMTEVIEMRRETVDSAAAAVQRASDHLRSGLLVRIEETNDDPECFDWFVFVYELADAEVAS